MDGTEDAEDPKESLPPPGQPFRPWRGSGTHQPGADRPRSAVPTPRQVPQPDLTAPRYTPAARVPSAPRDRGSSTPRERRVVVLVLAAIAAATAWMPWYKLPAVGSLGGADSGLRLSWPAWDLPARYLWSTRSGFGDGFELGWFVVGFAGLIALAWSRTGDVRTVRILAGLEAGIALLFMIQTARIVDAVRLPVRVTNAPSYGFADFTGFGVYVLLVVSVAILVVARR